MKREAQPITNNQKHAPMHAPSQMFEKAILTAGEVDEIQTNKKHKNRYTTALALTLHLTLSLNNQT